MLKVDSDGVIHLTRGDTARLSLDITNELTSEAYTPKDGDVLRMTVRRSELDGQIIFQKIADGATFSIVPSDTSGQFFGTYVYDIELTTAEGEVYTVIPPTVLKLTKEVTW